jgi:hypothetical protein
MSATVESGKEQPNRHEAPTKSMGNFTDWKQPHDACQFGVDERKSMSTDPGGAQPVANDKWLEIDARGARDRHSDKEKLPGDPNRPQSDEMPKRLLKTLRKSGDSQAESEGSIPFTRSSALAKHVPPNSRQIQGNQKWPKPTST